jgi:two-component sensor histidine kinase
MMPKLPKRLPLRFRLAVLVAGTTLPLIFFSADIVYLNYEANRQNASDRILEFARAMTLNVERELQSTTAALQALALSRALRAGDIEGFRPQAEEFLQHQRAGANLVLIDRNGRQILNSAAPAGTPLPVVNAIDAVRTVFATKRPVVTNYRISPVLNRPIVSVDVPVTRGDQVIYDLSLNPTIELFNDIIQQQRPPERWVVSVFDASGVHVARTPNPDRFVGSKASDSLFPSLMTKPEGVIETTSLEGTALLTAFSKSASTGWSVAVGMPRELLTEPLWRSIAITIALGVGCLLTGLAFAVRMARRIARAEAHRELLINELNHRVKNTLTTVQSIATRTLGQSGGGAEAVKALEARLVALSRTHNVLSEERWESADLREIVSRALDPYIASGRSRVHLWGPDVRLSPRAALTLALVLHELATNAAKYGALSKSEGRISVEWHIANNEQGPRVHLSWIETGGPAVQNPERKGFGSTLIERSVAYELQGTAELHFDPSGVICRIEIPLRSVRARREDEAEEAPFPAASP